MRRKDHKRNASLQESESIAIGNKQVNEGSPMQVLKTCLIVLKER